MMDVDKIGPGHGEPEELARTIVSMLRAIEVHSAKDFKTVEVS